MPYLQLSTELNIHYEDIRESGSPTVLLLHGLGANSESWGMQVPALQRAGFRLLIPDTRGFGKSSFPGGEASIRRMARDMVDLLKNLSVAEVVVIGISMGGTLALQMALDNPKLVSRLVLINTFACLRPRQASTWLYFLSRFALAHIIGVDAQARTVAQHLFPHPEDSRLRQIFINQIEQADPAGYRAAMRALARFDVSDRLREISIPTLIITGERDTTVPREVQDRLATGISCAHQVIIPGASHPVTVEQPEKINELLIDFISDQA